MSREEAIRWMVETKAGGLMMGDKRVVEVCDMAIAALREQEVQQARIADLKAELVDERYRHDRVQDFEVAEAQELAMAKSQLDEAIGDLQYLSVCSTCSKNGTVCHVGMPVAENDACCGGYRWRGAKDMNVPGKSKGVEIDQFNRWIPVGERLPETEGCYLIYTAHGSVCTGHYYPRRRFHNDYIREPGWGGKFTVTHWMPMPEPPKEVG